MTPTQADVGRWAAILANAYAAACRPVLPASDAAWLARELGTPLANCLMLRIPAADWPVDYVNPTLARWEAMSRRRPGPRLQAVDYPGERVAMG